MRKLLVVGLIMLTMFLCGLNVVFAQTDDEDDIFPTPPPGGGGSPALCGWYRECVDMCTALESYCCSSSLELDDCRAKLLNPLPINCCTDLVWCDESRSVDQKCRTDLNCCLDSFCTIDSVSITCDIGFTGLASVYLENGCGDVGDISNQMWVNNCGTTHPAW